MTTKTVLIVDDEPNILTSLKRALEIEEYRVLTAGSGAEALKMLEKKGADVLLADVAMPEMDGLQLLERVKTQQSQLPVVMMSGHSTIETAVQATKLGAHDFVEKPISTDRLLLSLDNALRLARLREENEALKEAAGSDAEMVGTSGPMRQIHGIIRKTAPTMGRVLITGENGTGKELVARAIHRGSPRAGAPFIKVNCAAIPQELIESELFGHEKGAFTGATRMRKGKFESAHQGTLFLDEIGDMSLGAQAKVLRALQEDEIERVGSSETIRVDVRDRRDQQEHAARDCERQFSGGPLLSPQRHSHRAATAARASGRHSRAGCFFLTQACHLHGKRQLQIEQEAVTLLMQHPWPGNVRELKNSIERLVILSEGDISAEEVRAILPSVKPIRGHYQRGVSLREMVSSAERELILRALDDCDGHVSKTAEALGLERSHLYKKMKTLGIDHRPDQSK